MRSAHEHAQGAGGPAWLAAKNDPMRGRTRVCGRWTRVAARFAALYLVLACSPAHADVISEGDRVMLQLGPYVYHRIDNTGHNQWPRLIGLEYESVSHWLAGAVSFRNSYYQNAAYLYGGKRWFIDGVSDHLYFKLSAGLVYGYKEPYENKLPVNHNGYGLGIVPALGLQYGRVNAQIELLGTIGLAFTFGYDILN
jgi:hypothetical protein